MHSHLHVQGKIAYPPTLSHKSFPWPFHSAGSLCILQVWASAVILSSTACVGSSGQFEKIVGHLCKQEFMHALCCIGKLS